jgi:uncharacterized phiE125 gp8 family phage protein
VISLTQVSTWYEGTESVEASLAGFYVLPGDRPEVRFTSTGEFTADDIDTVELRYTAGYGAAASAVPDDLTIAVRYLLTTFYDRRDEQGADEIPMPGIVTELCGPYIIHTL